MLLTKEVEVKLWPKNIQYYHDKGYEGKVGDIITVKVKDLSKFNRIRVNVLCDFCQREVLYIQYSDYCRRMEKTGTCACSACKTIKAHETNIKKYGCISPMMLDEYKQKAKDTSIKKFGVDSYSKTKECQDKKRITNLERYGYECSFQNESVKEKFRENNMKKYGVSYPSKLKEVQEKIKQTWQEKYGTENISQNEEIKKKKANTFYERYGVTSSLQLDSVREVWSRNAYETGSISTSKQQKYLHNLYGGELNYPISYYLADICLIDEKIDIEYNGGGHNLGVKTGKITQSEFNQKEYLRDNTIKKEGYKIMKIISSKDLLPSDTILLQMLNESRTYFNSTPHTWCTFDIDNSTIRNAEHKTGTPYDFGELRQVKEAS